MQAEITACMQCSMELDSISEMVRFIYWRKNYLYCLKIKKIKQSELKKLTYVTSTNARQKRLPMHIVYI